MVDPLTLGIVIGLVAMFVALFERGYKRYLEEKKVDPELKFSAEYFLNMLLSAGGIGIIITLIIPAIITAMTQAVENNPNITLATVLLEAAIGYLATYRVLDGLNNSTSANITNKKIETEAKLQARKESDKIETTVEVKPEGTT